MYFSKVGTEVLQEQGWLLQIQTLNFTTFVKTSRILQFSLRAGEVVARAGKHLIKVCGLRKPGGNMYRPIVLRLYAA